MKTSMRRLSNLLAGAAGLALVAGYAGTASAATDPVSSFLTYLTTPPAAASQVGDHASTLYPNYNPNANLGQGSGNSGGFGR